MGFKKKQQPNKKKQSSTPPPPPSPSFTKPKKKKQRPKINRDLLISKSQQTKRELETLHDQLSSSNNNSNNNNNNKSKKSYGQILADKYANDVKKRIEIEELRLRLLQTPNVNDDSLALRIALSGIEDALRKVSNGSVVGGGGDNSDVVHSNGDNDNLYDDEENFIDSKPRSTSSSSSSSSLKPILTILLRILLLDLPLLLLPSILHTSTHTLQYLYQTYYHPILTSMLWSESLAHTDFTYYYRPCTPTHDVSTQDVDDIILGPDRSRVDGIKIMERHGNAIVPGVISEEHAGRMREWVLKRNGRLRDDDADFISLIGQKHRWSFTIGAADGGFVMDEDGGDGGRTVVGDVMRDVVGNEQLRDLMEDVLGNEPALVELTTITSAYGSKDQHWHKDNELHQGQIGMARTYLPMFSIFIPLQDTTPQMGATDMVLGSHHCAGSQGELGHYHGIRLSNTRGRHSTNPHNDSHYWKTGDALLMNLVTTHRGPAHADPHGQDRVMMIMSVSPRPRDCTVYGYDRRQLALGTSYSNRWDMWGMTLSDLWEAEWFMSEPRKTLRTLGIYKGRGVWGLDWLSVACSQVVNEQFGFSFEDLEENLVRFQKKGGRLGMYLFGGMELDEEDEAPWLDMYEETIARLIKLSQMLFGGAMACYFVIVVLLGRLFLGGTLLSRTLAYTKRVLFSNVIIASVALLLLNHLSNTPWGRDVLNREMNKPPFAKHDLHTNLMGQTMHPTKDLLTTFPSVSDVLFSTRLDSAFLGKNENALGHHPANQKFDSLTSGHATIFASHDNINNNEDGNFPMELNAHIISEIIDGISVKQGRFLLQNHEGNWVILPFGHVIAYIRRALLVEADPLIKALDEELRYRISDCRHGRFRHSALMHRHAPGLLRGWQRRLFSEGDDDDDFGADDQEEEEEEGMVGGKKKKGNKEAKQDIIKAKLFKKNLISFDTPSSSIKPNIGRTKTPSHRLSSKYTTNFLSNHIPHNLFAYEFEPGDFIQGNFDGRRWFKGEILYINDDEDDYDENDYDSVDDLEVTYDVWYEDADIQEYVAFEDLRWPIHYMEGDRVVVEQLQGDEEDEDEEGGSSRRGGGGGGGDRNVVHGVIKKIYAYGEYDLLLDNGEFIAGCTAESFTRHVDIVRRR